MARTGKECKNAEVRQIGLDIARQLERLADLAFNSKREVERMRVLSCRILWYITRSIWSRLSFKVGRAKSRSRWLYDGTAGAWYANAVKRSSTLSRLVISLWDHGFQITEQYSRDGLMNETNIWRNVEISLEWKHFEIIWIFLWRLKQWFQCAYDKLDCCWQ